MHACGVLLDHKGECSRSSDSFAPVHKAANIWVALHRMTQQ